MREKTLFILFRSDRIPSIQFSEKTIRQVFSPVSKCHWSVALFIRPRTTKQMQVYAPLTHYSSPPIPLFGTIASTLQRPWNLPNTEAGMGVTLSSIDRMRHIAVYSSRGRDSFDYPKRPRPLDRVLRSHTFSNFKVTPFIGFHSLNNSMVATDNILQQSACFRGLTAVATLDSMLQGLTYVGVCRGILRTIYLVARKCT